MINFLKKIFGEKADVRGIIKSGAVIVDVRTADEFRRGHVKDSINIPLDSLQQKMKGLDKNKTIITCCESGGRSSAARRLLISSGFKNVHNGGSWRSLN